VRRLIIDTSGYLAGTAAKHPLSEAIRDILRAAAEPPVVSPLVLAEIDYMVLDKAGVAQELAVIDDLTSGAYEIADVDDVRVARTLAARHATSRPALPTRSTPSWRTGTTPARSSPLISATFAWLSR
jgi:hypothetical protein